MADDAVRQHGAGEPDQLERLWTPYRMAYIRGDERPSGTGEDECPFCRIPRLGDAEGLVVHRGETAYVVLNLFPYAAGPPDGLPLPPHPRLHRHHRRGGRARSGRSPSGR